MNEAERIIKCIEEISKRNRIMDDAINPKHYKRNGMEAIDVMKAFSTEEEYQGHLRLTALKYLLRVGHKDEEIQELKKAKWYLDRLISEKEQ